MIKKTITYQDFNGESHTEDFYFHLNEVEITELQFSKDGGLDKMLERIVNEQDNREIVAFFKELLIKSVGKKSPDGKLFVKNDEIRDAFIQSPAYPKLFMDMANSAESATVFVNGIIPKIPEFKKKDKQDKNPPSQN